MASSDKGFLGQHGNKIRWISIAVLIAGLMLLMRALPTDVLQSALEDWVDGLGFWGPIAFGAVYVVATVVLIPASLLTLAAGAVFGLWLGLLVVSISSVTGAACAFLIARYLARSKVEHMAEKNDKFGAIDDAITEGGWKIVAMLRLSPAVPFGLQNYLYGLTKIGFWPYVLTSWIAMLPGTLLYVYLGVVASTAAGGGGEKSPAQWVFLVIGLLATLVVTVYITRLARKKLAERTDVEKEKEASSDGPSAGSVIGLAVAAALVVALGVFAQVRSDAVSERVEKWVGSSSSDSGDQGKAGGKPSDGGGSSGSGGGEL